MLVSCGLVVTRFWRRSGPCWGNRAGSGWRWVDSQASGNVAGFSPGSFLFRGNSRFLYSRDFLASVCFKCLFAAGTFGLQAVEGVELLLTDQSDSSGGGPDQQAGPNEAVTRSQPCDHGSFAQTLIGGEIITQQCLAVVTADREKRSRRGQTRANEGEETTHLDGFWTPDSTLQKNKHQTPVHNNNNNNNSEQRPQISHKVLLNHTIHCDY